ncbi:DUF4124 domain-containing protein [Sansalvadorimonas sp. 2012CJ34-2]|uniref:DUF4124 domain-containing protein n=1 Tax=Parendozoicomonas callyspongiae TaxID=2942213 RepID=A0ABT0PDC3_9GAMM|nr:DUF4124 domain-containing protein [Sansalvadorimonas sp. 2012CJ34-2]MCL6269221.1 DUF4124 domain-containing protein [Sansalvadorimonas sp. 2012CJ34-2]
MSGLIRLLTAGISILLVTFAVNAEVYKVIDENGNVTYTNKKAETKSNTAPVELGPIQTIPAPKITPSKTKPRTKAETFYKSIEITYPLEQETYQNPESIAVTLKSTPPLGPGHRYRLSINGKTFNEGKTPQFVMDYPDRGSYTIKAEILNAKGKSLISSSPRTIFVHRSRVNAPKPQSK